MEGRREFYGRKRSDGGHGRDSSIVSERSDFYVDIGMDVFAFRDDREDVSRIQVKTAPGKRYKNGGGYHAKFGVPMAQLRRPDNPPLFYALAVRLAAGWGTFVVIGRAELQELWN